MWASAARCDPNSYRGAFSERNRVPSCRPRAAVDVAVARGPNDAAPMLVCDTNRPQLRLCLYLKQIDFEFYKNLESAVSKRMYRFLDKRFITVSGLNSTSAHLP